MQQPLSQRMERQPPKQSRRNPIELKTKNPILQIGVFVLHRSRHQSARTRLVEFTWDNRSGPVMFVNVGGSRLGFALFCHREPERSFRIPGYTFPLCSRCTGLAAGLGSAFALALLNFQIPLSAGFLLMLPMALDAGTQLLGLRESSNLLRFLTGFLFALGCLALLVKL